MAHLGPFLVIAVALIVTPGPDTALTIRNALVGGRRGGVATAFGVVVDDPSGFRLVFSQKVDR